jgi:hypothetical protein
MLLKTYEEMVCGHMLLKTNEEMGEAEPISILPPGQADAR